jgi:hypothetical protein
MTESSDPKIVNRLGNLPPFKDKDGNIVGTPPEEPKVEEEVKKEDPKEEVKVEAPSEEKKEEPKVEEPKEEEVTEEEALANSKNPERTKKFIEKLKKQNEELKKPPEPKQNVLESLTPEAPEIPQWPAPPTTNVVPTPKQYPGLTQAQINEVFKTTVDDQGYVDAGLLDGILN